MGIQHEIKRYVMLSAMGADRPDSWSDEMKPYYEAKAEADKIVSESGLDYTIVRPGHLTDDPQRVPRAVPMRFTARSPRSRRPAHRMPSMPFHETA